MLARTGEALGVDSELPLRSVWEKEIKFVAAIVPMPARIGLTESNEDLRVGVAPLLGLCPSKSDNEPDHSVATSARGSRVDNKCSLFDFLTEEVEDGRDGGWGVFMVFQR